VVTDRDGNALYFSRSPIPMARDLQAQDPLPAGIYFHHLGLYVYRKSFLTTFSKLPPGRLEELEQLEQLRALEHGYRIRVVEVDEGTVEVNAPDDLVAAEAAYHGRR